MRLLQDDKATGTESSPYLTFPPRHFDDGWQRKGRLFSIVLGLPSHTLLCLYVQKLCLFPLTFPIFRIALSP